MSAFVLSKSLHFRADFLYFRQNIALVFLRVRRISSIILVGENSKFVYIARPQYRKTQTFTIENILRKNLPAFSHRLVIKQHYKFVVRNGCVYQVLAAAKDQ